MENPSTLPSDPAERIFLIKKDPWFFLEHCVFTLDQTDENQAIKRFPANNPDMADYLRLYTRIWEPNKRIAVPKSRRMFMTWTNIALHLWIAMFGIGKSVAVVSKKEDDSNELLKRMKFIYEHIPKEVIDKKFLPKMDPVFGELRFPETDSFVKGFAQGDGQLRQYTMSAILADEMAFWEQPEEAYSASVPTLEGGGRLTAISSPAPGFFRRIVTDRLDKNRDTDIHTMDIKSPMQGVDIWKNPHNKFVIFQLHYHANLKKRDPRYIDEVRSSMPSSQFKREYELQWESFAGQPVYPDFDVNRHVSKKPLEPEIGLPLLRGWDWGLCYDDETEVLTKAGWKLFKDVSPHEEVATLDPDTFTMRYERPKLKIDKPYKGEMISWDSQSLSACITPDHIVPVWKEESKKLARYHAKDLMASGHNLIRMTAKWDGEDSLNVLGVTPKLFAAFMGAYLSEGCTDKKRISLYQKESNKGWMREILSATEWDWREFNDGFRLYDPGKAGYLSSFGLAGEKFVPEEIRLGTKETIIEFIRTYTLGDGKVRTRENGSEEHTIYTKSKRMADDLSDLALKVGWTSSITWVPPTESYLAQEDRIIKSAGGWSILFKKTTDWSHLREAKKEKIQYDGRVYCLSVSTGILCVRKNGRPHWNGNTPSCIIAQFVEGQLRILCEFVANNMGADKFSDLVIARCRTEYVRWSDAKRNWRDFIDPAGHQRAQTDEVTCAQVLVRKGLVPVSGAITFEARRGSVERLLIRHTKEGPGILVDPNCKILIDGFKGGYHYPEKATEIEPGRIRPLKNEYSHPHDALQYLCSRIMEMDRKKSSGIASPSYVWGQKEPEAKAQGVETWRAN